MLSRIILFALLITLVTASLPAKDLFWEEVNKPTDLMMGDQIFDVMVDKSGRVYLVMFSNKLLYTDDYTETWEKLDLPDNKNFNFFIIDRYSRLFCQGTDSYYTDDQGKNWTKLDAMGSKQFLFYNEGEMFAIEGNKKVYKSPDNGNSWSEVFRDSLYIRDFIISKNGNMYAGIGDIPYMQGFEGGVRMSTDNGETWKNTPLFGDMIVQDRTLEMDSSGTVFASIREEGGTGSVFRSTEGLVWNPSNFTDICISILTIPNGDMYATGANSSVYRSTNGGVTWENQSNGIMEKRTFYPVVLNPGDGKLYSISVFGDIYRTTTPVMEPSDVDEINDIEEGFIVYPNPASEKAKIVFNEDFDSPLSFSIINMLGETVKVCGKQENKQLQNSITIDVSDLPQGCYYITALNNKKVVTGKLIIAR